VKILSFVPRSDAAAAARPGLLVDADVLDLRAAAPDLPDDGPCALADLDGPWLRAARDLDAAVRADVARRTELRERGALLPLETVRLRAPLPRPGKFICIGLNYKDHAKESGMELPERPLVFSKFPSCVCGPDDEVLIPSGSDELDYEAELGVVIGRRARFVAADRAREHVLGYVNLNDVSARDFQFADGQWQRGKSCDTFAPMGPYVVTTDEIPDPHALRIRFRLDGRTLQDSSTNQLIFDVPELVARLSVDFTLEPGDVISTGTPPGVGFARRPPIFLRPGNRMEVEIDGLGVLSNVIGRARAP
jgi:2-keto-4-pentenoate hydratase/2-oxohepta-3-ene-1,7-dioic acid hydratase in catechol pathway